MTHRGDSGVIAAAPLSRAVIAHRGRGRSLARAIRGRGRRRAKGETRGSGSRYMPTPADIKRALQGAGFEIYRTQGDVVHVAERVRENLLMDSGVFVDVALTVGFIRAALFAGRRTFQDDSDDILFEQARDLEARGARSRLRRDERRDAHRRRPGRLGARARSLVRGLVQEGRRRARRRARRGALRAHAREGRRAALTRRRGSSTCRGGETARGRGGRACRACVASGRSA